MSAYLHCMLNKVIRLIRRCLRLALPFGRKKLAVVFAIIFLNGIFELIGAASVLPFFALASDPQDFMENPKAQWLFELLPEMTTNQLLMSAGIFSIVMLFVASATALLNQVVRVRYGFALGHSLRTRMMKSLAARPYSYFLGRNTGQLLQKTVDDVGRFINEVFLPLLDVLSRSVTILFLVTAAIAANPPVALGIAGLFGTFYALVYLFVRKHSLRIGAMLRSTNRNIMIYANQFFGSIKTVLVNEKADYFISKFVENSKRQSELLPKARLFSFFPRTMIEPLAYGALVAVVVVMAGRGESLTDILPSLSVMLVAGMRLIPAFQSLYSQLNNITTMSYTLNEVEEEILEVNKLSDDDLDQQLEAHAPKGKLTFQKEIALENVTIQYPEAPAPVLSGLTLTVPKKSSIGIIGPTGSGKSTLIDTILGLHQIQSGTLRVDDRPLRKSDMPTWRGLIGYVPQDIYLIDGTVAENIAFGIPEDEIDHDLVKKVAHAAQIGPFIENEMPGRYATEVGERGVRLSGGQRQRIGLARALYVQPDVLILDEATSALDIETEKEVMKAIDALQGTLTILIVAHRLSTIEACDQVVNLGDFKTS